MPPEVRHEAEHVQLRRGHGLPPRGDQLLGRDPGLVLLRGRVHGLLGEVGRLLELEIAGAHAEAHLRAAAERTGDLAHESDLAAAVQRHARADADRLLEQRARLAAAVDRDQLRRHPARERGVQLGGTEDVAAEALLCERAAQGERVVGLDGRQHARGALGPGGREGAREAPRVAAQLILGDHRERRAEALGQRCDVAVLDPQAAVGAGQAVVDPLRIAGHAATLCDLLRGSFVALTGRWSDGLIRPTTRKRYRLMNVIRTPAGKLRRRAAIGVVGLAALGGGGAAVAASKDSSPSPQAQTSAIAADAAGQLGVSTTALTAAIKTAMVDQIEAQVTAGTITKAQATAMEARLAKADAPLFALGGGRGGPGDHGHGRGFDGPGGGGMSLDAAATYIGVTATDLRTQLAAGKTLATIATDNGKTVDGLKAALTAAATKDLDAAVTAGTLTATQETKILADLPTRLDHEINEVHSGGPGAGGPGGPPPSDSSSSTPAAA